MTTRIIVVGGGVSGLSVSFELLQRADRIPGGIEVLCFEAAPRPGGNIRTQREHGFTCEWGPNGFLDNVPATLDLVRRLGIEHRLLPSNAAAAKRFLFRGGKLKPLPSGAGAFLTSDLLSVRGRLRVLTEPFRGGPKDREADESVFSFAARRIGAEAASVLVDAMVSGIYAGDVKNLSFRATFPKLYKMEREHGSLTRAMLSRRSAKRSGNDAKAGGPAGPGGKLTSFLDGFAELTDHLALAIQPALRLGVEVTRVSDMGNRGFRVHLAEGAPVDAAAVVLACPAAAAARMLRDMDPDLARTLGEIGCAGLAVVHLGYDEASLGGKPDGFGFLIPRGEGLRTLGTLWSSSIFTPRAPEGKALLTSMVGGAHDPGAAELPDDALVDLIRRELATTMGVSAVPVYTRIFRHALGIPQYTLGHPDRLTAIDQALTSRPGLRVAGNSYRGISVNACVEEAPNVAESILTALAERRPPDS